MKYCVYVTESIGRKVYVEADSAQEARDQIENEWNLDIHFVTYDNCDFFDVDFTTSVCKE